MVLMLRVPVWRRRVFHNLVDIFNGGYIFNISSLAGVNAFPGGSAYNASKFGVVGLTMTMAIELAPHNIRVNVIAPSFLSTRLTDALIARTGENIKRWTPLGRIGRPDEIRGAVVFLASEASSYITGQILCLDGGTTAW